MIRILAFLAALFVSSAAWAQSAVIPYCGTGNAAPNDFGACSAAHPLPARATELEWHD